MVRPERVEGLADEGRLQQVSANLPDPDRGENGRGQKAGSSTRRHLAVGLVGAFVASAVAVAVVIIGFLVVFLPTEQSASIPGLIDLDRSGQGFVVEFGPLVLLLPILGSLVLGPLAASVLGKLRSQRPVPTGAR